MKTRVPTEQEKHISLMAAITYAGELASGNSHGVSVIVRDARELFAETQKQLSEAEPWPKMPEVKPIEPLPF